MGADVSSEGGYTSRQAAEFEQKYREMYGEDLSREELIERYRMEKLKADQKQREEKAKREAVVDRYLDEHEHRSRKDRRRSRDRDSSHYESRKRQEDNFDIIQRTYQSSKRDGHHGSYDDRREHRSHRSRKHREYDNSQKERSSHRRHSSRDRERRRSTSRSSSKENHKDRHSSGKMRSLRSDDRHKRASRRSDSTDDRDRRERSSRHKDNRRSSPSSKHRSTAKSRKEPASEDEKKKNKHESRQKKKQTLEENNESSKSKTKKKKKSTKAEHYKSAPDLTESDRQYGRGPWQRTHNYFDEYSQRPQSWVQEMAQENAATMPAPVMERQIIYSVPHASSQIVDGLGYPLKERSPGFQPVPYNTYLMQNPSRPLSLDVSMQQSQLSPTITSAPRSQQTEIKLPAGAVPALGPAGIGLTSLPVQPEFVIPGRGYEVQAHLPSSRSATLPSKNAPSYITPPQYASSTLPRSDGPTPKPRTKSPSKEQKSFFETSSEHPSSPRKSRDGKQHKITATSAREDFESMLAFDYEVSGMKTSGDFSREFPPTFPGNYRPNQEIFVDDVIFRKHPDIVAEAASLTDSDAVTDEEHVLTLGQELSPNSMGYSSGFDLEIPEGFCFDSEGKEMSPSKKKKEPQRKKQDTKLKKASAKQTHQKSEIVVLGAVEPVARVKPRKSAGSEKKKSVDNEMTKSGKQKMSTMDQYTGNRGEKIIYPSKAAMQKSKKHTDDARVKRRNKRIQHPPKDNNYKRIIIPSRKWVSKPEPKKTHDIGVGTKPVRNLKSKSVQTSKQKDPPAQPIYFLKPISSHEVFIDDSSVASRSETDMSQAHTTTATSSGSNHARSSASWSRSSTVSSTIDHTETSEVESVIMMKQKKSSQLHPSNEDLTPAIVSPVIESEQTALGPYSMVLGVSESIQASSYTGKGGKVFCLTRSRQGSPPPTLSRATTEDARSVDAHELHQPLKQSEMNPVITGWTFQDQHSETNSGIQKSPSNKDYEQFDAHEVGKWVLDCYAQDHRIKSKPENEVLSSPRSSQGSHKSRVLYSHGQLTKQQAVEYEASFTVDSEDLRSPKSPRMPTVLPLTTEALSKHNGRNKALRSPSQTEESATELSGNLSTELGVFQKELIKSRRRIQNQRERTPQPEWKTEEYKAKLKQWNNSPTSNVVLAEVCSVTDEDLDDPPNRPLNTTMGMGPSQDISDIKPQNDPILNPTNLQSPTPPNQSGSDTESTLSQSSDEEIISPKESLRKALNKSNLQLQQIPPEKEDHNPAMKLQKSGTFQDGLNQRNVGYHQNSRFPVQPHPDEDWRIVGAPKKNPTMYRPLNDISGRFSQQDPIVPRAEMQRKSAMEANQSQQQPTLSAPEELKLRSASLNSDTTSCPSPIANPFNKMDEDEINSLVMKIPGRGSLDNPGSEKEIIEKLEKSRQDTKRESLEERTARILGIHRRTSSDDEKSMKEKSKPILKQHENQEPVSTAPGKRDLSTYMNNLLTGVTDVSPDTRKKYFLGDMGAKSQVTSPLTTSSVSSKDSQLVPQPVKKIGEQQRNIGTDKTVPQQAANGDSSETSDDEHTEAKGSSVNVGDNLLASSVNHQQKADENWIPSPPPTDSRKASDMETKERENMISPTGVMMQSYGNNIYAETPGFHRQQQSFDSSESDEPELDVVPMKILDRPGLPPNRVQDSPVPISATSPPLTEKELDIVRELVNSNNHSRSASQSSVGAVDEGRVKPDSILLDANRLSPDSTCSTVSNRSWSPGRQRARNKIAQSIGFTLNTRKGPSTHDSKTPQPAFDTSEYDIKILTVNGDRNASKQQPGNEVGHASADKGHLNDVMESIGLDPSESWLMSV